MRSFGYGMESEYSLLNLMLFFNKISFSTISFSQIYLGFSKSDNANNSILE
jgi:hypothetical protein